MPAERKTQIGHAAVDYRPAHGILTRATGFINAFDYTLNPYNGCSFACNYCYAAFFALTEESQARWGYWVRVKENALDLLRRRRKRPLIERSIYMSSVTDPYQPIEAQLGLTRAILEELLAYHQVRLVIQTRSPLVQRDADLLRQFDRARVHMTVTTDDDSVRKAFEPLCPSNARRLVAVRRLNEAGIDTAITLTPLLPVRDPAAFARDLAATGTERFVVQYFHATHSRFVAGTGQAAREAAAALGWDEARYQTVVAVLRAHLPLVYEGREGFAPD